MKSKQTTTFVCQECGYETTQWLGKCPECGVWNSLKEFQISNVKSQVSNRGQRENSIPKKLSEVEYDEKERFGSGFGEMDAVLGKGIVPGSVILLAGDPGIGKSTLLLQVALNIAKVINGTKETSAFSTETKGRIKASVSSGSFVSSGTSVLYISGEESEQQIKLRANRLAKKDAENLYVLSQTDIDQAILAIQDMKPSFVIVDSIQTMESEGLEGLAGSVGQVRYAAFELIKMAKTLRIPVMIVGHVTKEGMVAGPMILSHMVDVMLLLEGERHTGTRLLRSLKNRFGPVDEVGVFSMETSGMQEVKNAQQLFMTDKKPNVPGSSLVVTIEGTRAFLVEVQALVVFSKLPMPRRVASGVDPKRLELLLAVLQKYCNLPLSSQDVFVSVTGGLKLSDPAADLGICLAIYSSLKNLALSKTVGIAEVGLQSELRTVTFLDKRIKEAKKLGFKTIVTAQTQKSLVEVIRNLK